ncbi:GTP-binding protein [Candidatus Bathyarchaeota archaeon]|nr:GTP-binding protein [Candidatus Bathyarchaeota archaeon]
MTRIAGDNKLMIHSSDECSKDEAMKVLFENFTDTLDDTSAILVMDAEKETILASHLSEGESEESLKIASTSIKRILDRLTKELITGSGPVSFFDTDKNRLMFIKIKDMILSIVLKLDGSLDKTLPYAYLTAEKVGNIMEGRPVELDIPLIKIITDEEEQRSIRNHFFELRSSKGVFTFKLIIIGEQNVGKTSLILRHAEDKFKENYLPTLGVSITTSSVELPLRRATVNFSTWDFGGQSYFRRVRLSYYAGAQACLIVFDLTNRESFESVMKWHEEKKKLSGDIITILLGNKSDLVGERVITLDEAHDLAKQLGCSYFETSALTGANVGDVFNLLAYKLVDIEAKKVEKNELEELKSALEDCSQYRGEKVRFGLISNRKYFSPILQVFLDLDSSPGINSLDQEIKEYDFDYDFSLVTTEIIHKEFFAKQLQILKELNGLVGIYDARRDESIEDTSDFARFLKLVMQNASKEDFSASIGILCEKDDYSLYLNALDVSDILKRSQNANKSIFFYNLSKNYLLEILDNLKMFFTSYSLMV